MLRGCSTGDEGRVIDFQAILNQKYKVVSDDVEAETENNLL